MPEQRTIKSGIGIDGCRIGDERQSVITALGTPKASNYPEYLCFPHLGIEACLEEGQVHTIFLYFRTENQSTCNAVTDLGIGVDSKIEDVIAAYGVPNERSDIRVQSLSYGPLGIEFNFKGGQLSDIRVTSPRPDSWPQEWPRRTTTGASSWLAFAGDEWLRNGEFLHATFLEFARYAELERWRVLPAYEAIGVKAFFESLPKNPMFGEHIYLTDIRTDGSTITGTLNSSAFRRTDLKEDDEVTFPIEHLSDWYLVRDGKGLGGFNVANTLAELSGNELELAKSSPPFIWYAYRGDQTAIEQLFALMQCPSCERRNFFMEPVPVPQAGPCPICQNGGRRCECPTCNAPLIRYPNAPEQCFHCAR